MPNWSEVVQEITEQHAKFPKENPIDPIRRKYLHKVFEITGRNTIAYYSG